MRRYFLALPLLAVFAPDLAHATGCDNLSTCFAPPLKYDPTLNGNTGGVITEQPYIDASNVLHIPGTSNGVSGYITVPGAAFAPVVPPAAALALGGATFAPTTNVTSMTASQASTGAPILLTAPAALNTSNKQGVVTPSANAGSYIFDVTNTTPGAPFYNAGLMILGDGGAVGALDGFYNASGGVSYEVDEWGGSTPYAGSNQNQLASGNVQSFTGNGVRHCLKAVITRGPDNINLLASPYSTASSSCPQGGWVSFYSYASAGLGYAKQLGPFVDPLDAPQNGAAANGNPAKISLNRYAYTTSTDPQAGF